MEPPGKPRKHLEGIAEQESLHQADEGGPQAEVACQGGFPVSWKEQACRGAPIFWEADLRFVLLTPHLATLQVNFFSVVSLSFSASGMLHVWQMNLVW